MLPLLSSHIGNLDTDFTCMEFLCLNSWTSPNTLRTHFHLQMTVLPIDWIVFPTLYRNSHKHILACTCTCAHHMKIMNAHMLFHTHTCKKQLCMHTCPFTHTHMHNCAQGGHSPLLCASKEGQDAVVEMLLQAGATVDLQNKVEDCYWVHLSLEVVGCTCHVHCIH